MPGDDGQETWHPRRERVFRALVWVLLVLIALGVLVTAGVGLMG